MESKKEVEVELKEIATVEEDKEKENKEKEDKEKKETKGEAVDEGNVYSSLTDPSEHVYGVPSSARSYTVNKDASPDIHRKVRVYRIISLVLFVICVLLMITVLVLFMKLTGTQPCQVVEETDRSPPEQLECSLEKCQQVYQQPIEGAQRLCSNCAKGWLKFENTCYFLSQNRLTWQKSREECQRKGGDLAVITNERVQMYLSRQGNLHYWIGLSRVGTNEWTWINNTVLTVRYWEDDSSTGECAILAANESPERSWRPSHCKLYLQYICQKM
ncbi:C-type lectin domain family 4 member C isoform X2 [Ctenopharyngodon idella]|uniref:C-type lectin domain family 4 member C isoform X2 n=1 Tax=Ctenopharyngodon idella TaxID=7959 RepID=UPI00222F2497|nr:C-type lectin domain family 4 member C isoform X2 [Ctenopharyngodon idella]